MKEHSSYFKLVACYMIFAMVILGISSNVNAATALAAMSTESGQTGTPPAVAPSQESMNNTTAFHVVKDDLGKDLMNEISDVNGKQRPGILIAQMAPYVEQPAFENMQRSREMMRENSFEGNTSGDSGDHSGGHISALDFVLYAILISACIYGGYRLMKPAFNN